jgi:hypothetical protein
MHCLVLSKKFSHQKRNAKQRGNRLQVCIFSLKVSLWQTPRKIVSGILVLIIEVVFETKLENGMSGVQHCLKNRKIDNVNKI